MDSFSRIYRRALWLSCLFCALFVVATSEAATRKYVKLPSKQEVINNPSLPPVRAGEAVTVTGQPLEGEYIPNPGSGTKGTPVKVLPRVDGSIPRTLNHVKNGLRGGIIGVGVSVGLSLLLDQVGGFIDEAGQPPKKYSEEPTGNPSLFWCADQVSANCTDADYFYSRYQFPEDIAPAFMAELPSRSLCEVSKVFVSSSVIQTIIKHSGNGCATINTTTFNMYKHGVCTGDEYYSESKNACVAQGLPVELDDSDYDVMFDFANQQNAEWLTGLLRDVCNGSVNPGDCFDQMSDYSALSGPSLVQGPITTKTVTSVTPEGLTSQTVVTSNTKYEITYGDTYYDYRKITTTTNVTDGVPGDETVEEDAEDITEEEKPEEEEEESPVLCTGASCDGPAYEDQYEPTTETKEDSIDDYMSRVQQIPILAAVGGMFDITVAGSCPVWEVHHSMEILGATMNIDLVFDYLCLSWFVAYGPWIRAVIYAVAAFAAVRVGLL